MYFNKLYLILLSCGLALSYISFQFLSFNSSFLRIILILLIFFVFLLYFKKINFLKYAIIFCLSFIFGSGYINFSTSSASEGDFYLKSEEVLVLNVERKNFYTEYDVKSNEGLYKIKLNTSEILYDEGENLSVSGQVLNWGTILPKREDEYWSSFDYKKYMINKGYLGYLENPHIEKLSRVNYFVKIKEDLKDRLFFKLKSFYNEKQAGVILGMVLGEKSYINKDLQDMFMKSGLGHFLVFSGFNFAVILGLFCIVFSGLGKVLRNILLLIISIIILFLVGESTSSVRAEFFLIIGLFLSSLNKKLNTKNLLWLFTCLYLLFNPEGFVYDVSFHLVFLACFSIIYLSALINRYNLFTKNQSFIVISLGVTLFIIPYSVYVFGGFSFLFIFSNILGSFAASAITLLGLFSLVFASSFNILNSIISLILIPVIDYFIFLADFLSQSYITLKGFSMPILLIVFIYLVYFSVYFYFLQKQKLKNK